MWYIEMGGDHEPGNKNKKKKTFQRNIFTTMNKKKEIRDKFNNTDVYSTIFQYDNEDRTKSRLYGPMYLDLDLDIESDAAFEVLKDNLKLIVIALNKDYDIPIDYLRFYFSGKKGFHIFIPTAVLGIEPEKKLNIYYKAFAQEISKNAINNVIDLRIYDNKRLIRLPNSINSKSGLYKVPVTYDDILNFSYKEMKEYAKQPRKIQYEKPQYVDKAAKIFQSIKENVIKTKNKKFTIPKNVDISKIKWAPCIKNIFEEGASKGARNNTTVILASAIFQKGVEFDIAYQVLCKWNDEKVDPSLSENEFRATIESAYQLVQSGRRYGCSSIKDMGLCTGETCSLNK